MLIKHIEITNFRQYKDTTKIEFATDSKQNVTVIMGDNGSGKTTFAQAFMWCLYGDNDFKIKELINREIRDEMLPGDDAKVRVCLLVNSDGKDYLIVREQFFYRNYKKVEVKGCKFNISFKNEETAQIEYMSEKQSNQFVKKMLPQELSRFFIFDGERIRTMSDEFEAGRSGEFANAVHGLIGLNAMRKAMEHFRPSLKSSVIGQYTKKIDDASDGKIKDYSDKIDALNVRIGELKSDYERLTQECASYRKEIEAAKETIRSMSPQIELKKQYDRTEVYINELHKNKMQKIAILMKQFSNNAMYYWEMPLVEDSLRGLKNADKLDKGIPKLHADTINFLLRRQQCICGEELIPGNKYYEEIHSLLDVVPPKSLGQSIGEYMSKIKKDVKIASTFREQFLAEIQAIRKDAEEIEKNERLLANLETQLADTDKAKFLYEKQKDFEIKLDKHTKSLEQLLKEIGTAESRIGYLTSEREKFVIQDRANMENRRFLEYARMIYEKMEEEYSQKEEDAREQLQDTINNIFNNIYEGGIQLQVDSRYNVKVIVSEAMATEDELERNTAQNYAIIFAFISGIIQMSKDKREEINQMYGLQQSTEDTGMGYPLIMDAPLSAFDKKRIKCICDTIPEIAEQVIIFIKDTDGEVAEKYMDEKIGKKYFLVADTNLKTHIEG